MILDWRLKIATYTKLPIEIGVIVWNLRSGLFGLAVHRTIKKLPYQKYFDCVYTQNEMNKIIYEFPEVCMEKMENFILPSQCEYYRNYILKSKCVYPYQPFTYIPYIHDSYTRVIANKKPLFLNVPQSILL